MEAVKSGRKTIVVVHPDYGRTVVKGARDNLDALIEAARRWKVQWSALMIDVRFEIETELRTSPAERKGVCDDDDAFSL